MINVKIGKALDLIHGLNNDSIDLIVTDPPYGIGVADWDVFEPEILKELHRVLKPGHAIFMYFSQRRIPYIQPLFEEYFTLKNIIIERKKNMVCTTWDKNTLQLQWEPIFFGVKPGEQYIEVTKRKFSIGFHGDYIEATVPQSNFNGLSKKVHKCQKDINVFKQLISLQSNEGDIILDPYLGSGTTARACRELNRDCIGFELMEVNLKLIEDRAMLKVPELSEWCSTKEDA